MNDQRRSAVLVIVPAFNEAATVRSVVESIADHGYDVLVVDDGSRDRTADEARAGGATVIRLPVNLGVGGALRCGFKYAVAKGYRAAVQCDADGQHPPADIDRLVKSADDDDVDLLIGSRFAAGRAVMRVSPLRRLAMRILAKGASRATGTSITDATSGFRVIRQPLLAQFARSFPAEYLGDTYEAVVTAGRAGYRVREIEAVLLDRSHGESSATTGAALRFVARAIIVAGARIHFSIEQSPRV